MRSDIFIKTFDTYYDHLNRWHNFENRTLCKAEEMAIDEVRKEYDKLVLEAEFGKYDPFLLHQAHFPYSQETILEKFNPLYIPEKDIMTATFNHLKDKEFIKKIYKISWSSIFLIDEEIFTDLDFMVDLILINETIETAFSADYTPQIFYKLKTNPYFMKKLIEKSKNRAWFRIKSNMYMPGELEDVFGATLAQQIDQLGNSNVLQALDLIHLNQHLQNTLKTKPATTNTKRVKI